MSTIVQGITSHSAVGFQQPWLLLAKSLLSDCGTGIAALFLRIVAVGCSGAALCYAWAAGTLDEDKEKGLALSSAGSSLFRCHVALRYCFLCTIGGQVPRSSIVVPVVVTRICRHRYSCRSYAISRLTAQPAGQEFLFAMLETNDGHIVPDFKVRRKLC